jgi:ABC-type phosphate transport system auxiliary subunit
MSNQSPDGNADDPARDRGVDEQTLSALSDLHACVLVLDAERRRLAARLDALPGPGVVPLQRGDLERRYTELSEELAALQATIARLRFQVDPESEYL